MACKDRVTGGRPLKRKVGTRRHRKTLLIFCEGERTEPEYLDVLKRQPAVRDVAAVDLRIETGHGGSVPRTLVSMAAAARSKALDEEAEIDEFWCVFDVEWPRNHPRLSEAIEQARQNNIQLAVSNPCFELWLILHFQDQGAWLDNNAARRARRSLDGANDKGLDAAKYMPLAGDAARRAAELDQRHQRNGTNFPNDNPHLACTACSLPSSRPEPEDPHVLPRPKADRGHRNPSRSPPGIPRNKIPYADETALYKLGQK